MVTAHENDLVTKNMPSRRSLVNSVNRVLNKEISWFSSKQLDIPQILDKNTRGKPFFGFDGGILDQSIFVVFYSNLQQKILK